jgi:hypothetical protein
VPGLRAAPPAPSSARAASFAAAKYPISHASRRSQWQSIPCNEQAKAWELVAALEGNHREVRWNPETHLPEGPVTLF